jgi:hypothetical protein
MMSTRLVLFCTVALAIGTPMWAVATDALTISPECAGPRLSLEGADHYYWIEPSGDRILLDRACGPVEADCDHDVLVVWDADGRKLMEVAPFLDMAEMSAGMTLDATLRTRDRLVVSAEVSARPVQRVLAEYDVPSGNLLRAASTGFIRCLDLHADADGTTWCVGVDLARRHDGEDYDLVYRFDASGTADTSTLPRSTYPPEVHQLVAAGPRYAGGGGFLPGDGDIRLWLPAVGELVSFDDEGHVSDRLVLPEIDDVQRARLVSAPGDEIFAMFTVGRDDAVDEWHQALYRLASDGSAWEPLAGSGDTLPMRFALVGADEAGLILLDRRSLTLCHLRIPAGD